MRLLLLADTHIGFDLPRRPRVERRRRGHDFLANFRRALQPALSGQVDVVVHGGDLLFRSRVPPGIVEMALQPLVEVARRGVPVYLVPGNHERSRIPLHLWASHPEIHVFDRPRTFVRRVGGCSLALAGFPYVRDVRHHFGDLLRATGLARVEADAVVLCMHQAVEGARCGPGDFTFRHGQDVVRGRDIPSTVRVVLTGHIHRAQKLTRDLDGAPLAAPVLYPGSVERTSWAERDEPKGYAILTLGREAGVRQFQWVPLPARPMVDVVLASAASPATLEEQLRAHLAGLCPDAVVRVHLRGPWTRAAEQVLSAARLREAAPATMNIALARPRGA